VTVPVLAQAVARVRLPRELEVGADTAAFGEELEDRQRGRRQRLERGLDPRRFALPLGELGAPGRDLVGRDAQHAGQREIAPRGEHFAVPIAHRGALKRGLLAAGYPVDDVAGLVDGAPLDVPVKLDTFTPYPYQTAAVAAFRVTGQGVIVLPCGAGKTVIEAADKIVARLAESPSLLIDAGPNLELWSLATANAESRTRVTSLRKTAEEGRDAAQAEGVTAGQLGEMQRLRPWDQYVQLQLARDEAGAGKLDAAATRLTRLGSPGTTIRDAQFPIRVTRTRPRAGCTRPAMPPR
jgi:hypothetical protein